MESRSGHWDVPDARSVREVSDVKCQVSDKGIEWKIGSVGEIGWVRLVRNRGCLFGIGFHRDQLVHFVGADDNTGLIRPISTAESALLLKHLAALELNDQPDVETNSVAWRRWLGLLTK